jgi:hypothetical protein
MTLYARADVSYVCVPAESGGCGTPHSRPVINGAPAPQFVLNCQACENFLRADIARSGGSKKVRTINGDSGLALKERYLGLWGSSPDTVPEAPDDELKREHDEQAMVTKNAASQTQTLAQIGDAVKGNAELMEKFIELQLALAKNEQSRQAEAQLAVPPLPAGEQKRAEPRMYEYQVGGVLAAENSYTAESRACQDCGTMIERQPGQKGALPWRCPDCKAAKRRKAS